MRDRARATKDIDVVLRDDKADLAESLEQALTGDPYQGFSFRRKGEPLLLDNGAVNVEFAVTSCEFRFSLVFPLGRNPRAQAFRLVEGEFGCDDLHRL